MNGCRQNESPTANAAFTSKDINWWTGVVWITCRLLWCFYQLFGLTAPIHCIGSIGEQWYNAKFLYRWKTKSYYILDARRWVNFQQVFNFGRTVPWSQSWWFSNMKDSNWCPVSKLRKVSFYAKISNAWWRHSFSNFACHAEAHWKSIQPPCSDLSRCAMHYQTPFWPPQLSLVLLRCSF